MDLAEWIFYLLNIITMIVDAMTDMEVTTEIRTDYLALIGTSSIRISAEYNKERKKKSIPETAQYTRVFEIRTKKKNRWMVFLSNPPAHNKYKGNPCLYFTTYHYTFKGLRVFKIIPEGGLSVFNGHVFQRYNERMQLGIDNPLDRVRHFFAHNGFFHIQALPKGSIAYTIGRCREGLLLREVQNNLQAQIEETLNEKEFDKNRYEYLTDVSLGLSKENGLIKEVKGFKPSND
jgi:hypothetical protein